MSNVLKYKDYYGKVEYSSEDEVLFGKVEGISDLVVFEGYSIDEVKSSFENAVDDYLTFCKEIGKEPNKSYKGSFNIRITPELHKKADIMAIKQGISLNQFILNTLEKEINGNQKQVVQQIYVVNKKEKEVPYNVSQFKDKIIKQFGKDRSFMQHEVGVLNGF